jgi:uncharacterized membrane protein
MENTLAPDPVHNTHKVATLVYLLQFLGILFGITAFIGMFLNHTKFKDTQNSYVRSHFIWQLITFWSVCAIAAVAVLTWPSTLSKFLLVTGGLWWLLSVVAGAWLLRRHKPAPLFN